VGEITHPGAAVLFIYRNAEQAHITQLAPKVHWEFITAVNLGSPWGYFSTAKLKNTVAKHVDIFA
jgi:hypothetical protein